MPAPVGQRVRKRRDAMRAAGLRPVQIWLPDTRQTGFAEACRQQALRVASADNSDAELGAALDAFLVDLDDEV